MMKPTWQHRSWHVAHNFRSFLRSNRYPFDSELTAIKIVIGNAQSQLELIQNLCSGTSGGAAEELRKEEADIEAFLVIHRGFISAIRRFPREILCEIFCRILDMCRMVAQPNGEALNIFSYRQCPWVLGRICSEWRIVSIGLPPLWSRVNLQGHMILLSRDPEKMLTTCLERSGKHSLEIVIALQDYGMWLSMLSRCKTLLQLLSSQSQRWGSLTLSDGPRSCVWSIIGRLKDTQLPLLRELRLSTSPRMPMLVTRLPTCFRNCPRLRTFKLSNSGQGISSILNDLSCSQLTCFDWNVLTWDVPTLLDALRRMPNLVDFRCSNGASPYTHKPNEPLSVSLLHLCKISLTDLAILKYIDAPALQCIELFYPSPLRLGRTFFELSGNSSCRMEEARVPSFSTHIPILSHPKFQHIEELTHTRPSGSSGINRRIRFTNAHAVLPRLRKMNVGDHEILRWISAPALEDLQINNLDSRPAASISFLALHELSSCVLTRLTLQGVAALHVLTPTLLVRDLASLVELRVYEARYNEHLVQSLTVPAALPVLQRLVISLMISPHHRYDLPALAAMIECRWNISHQPVTISFSPRDHLFQSILHDDDGALVRRAMEAGKLSFSWGWALCGASEMSQ
ncbi:hypothetical protein IW261DRAFT_590087 [Armillaria novae-zelandiae]|uniref:F-box domain-containing protein n=1 Tax=Armillaria novae-zelandiae TaxID=153914 RepID=A0AA39UKU8_9AGAR|nr:hypothetical protein IW261DRAFT_590087 [Armillaria novae-zelandiae]